MAEGNRTWASKWLFIMAAIGAAAGLGNLWRFPYMVYENGGAAFMIAYIACLFVLVIPLVILEVGYGHTMRSDIITALGKQAGYFGRFVGWMLIGSLIALIGYYAAVIAWGADFLWFSPSVAWGNDAETFFYGNILQLSDSPDYFGTLSVPIILGLIVTYAIIYFSIFRGIDSISRVITWTVSLPFVLLGVLLINSLSLEGSMEGFRYLLIPDWSKLKDIVMWKDAASQSFFSANVGLAMTMFYAGFNEKEHNIVQSGLWISFGNALVSFLAAFAIFGTLGAMAHIQGVPITEVVASGPTLAFVAFPNAIAALPFGSPVFAVLFFIVIFTLAIDSGFAIVEVITDAIRQRVSFFKGWSHKKLLFLLCAVFFGWSLAFAGGNGLYRLDVIDHALWSHSLYWILIPEFIIIGWLTPVDALRKHINSMAKWKLGIWFNGLIRWIVPIFLIGLYVSSLPAEFAENYGGYETSHLIAWMYVPLGIIVAASLVLALNKRHA